MEPKHKQKDRNLRNAALLLAAAIISAIINYLVIALMEVVK